MARAVHACYEAHFAPMSIIQHSPLRLPLPAGWEDGTQVVALGPPEAGFRPNLVVSHEPAFPGETADDFAARQLPALKQALPGFAVVQESEETFGKLTGFLREHAFNARGAKLGQLQFYVLARGTAFTFTYTHLAAKFGVHRKMAELFLSQAQLG